MASNNLIPPSVNALASQIAGLPGQAYDYVTGRAKEIYQDPIGDVKRTLKKTQEKLDKTRDLQAKAFGGKSKTHEDITEEEAMSLLSEEMLNNIMNFAPAGIVKQVGGQFLKHFSPKDITSNPFLIPDATDPVKKWVETVGKNYIQNHMGTLEDPLRALANKGIVAHEAAIELTKKPKYSAGAKMHHDTAAELGIPGAGPAADVKTPQARWWDNVADESFTSAPAAQYQNTTPLAGSVRDTVMGPYISAGMRQNPWMANVSADTLIHQVDVPTDFPVRTVFRNVAGQLQKDLDAGLIRPEQLSKVSMPDAVTRTHQGLVKKIAAENDIGKTALVHKEYPTGDKWVELGPLPGAQKDAKSDFRLKALLGQEGKKMANCVGDYCDQVAKGETKVFSLRDAKGEPHVTIEVKPSIAAEPPKLFGQLSPQEVAELQKSVKSNNVLPAHINTLTQFKPTDVVVKRHGGGYEVRPNVGHFLVNDISELTKPSVAQIKGKGNTTKIKPQYQALVDDFIGDPAQWGYIKK